MAKEQIVIVGVGITLAIIAQIKDLYPDYEITIVDKQEDIKNHSALMEREPMRITREDLIFPEPLRVMDMKEHNPWPSPHHSSKKKRKY